MTERQAPREFDGRCERIAQLVAKDYTYPGADQADVIQEARIGVWKAIRDWRADRGCAFETFAWTCARRQAITGLKTATRGRARILTDAVSLETPVGDEGTFSDLIPAASSFDPQRIVLGREELREILENARALSALEKEVINRVCLHGEPYEALGDRKAVDNALQRARKKLAAEPLRLRLRKVAA